jgi:hypothetical protein
MDTVTIVLLGTLTMLALAFASADMPKFWK